MDTDRVHGQRSNGSSLFVVFFEGMAPEDTIPISLFVVKRRTPLFTYSCPKADSERKKISHGSFRRMFGNDVVHGTDHYSKWFLPAVFHNLSQLFQRPPPSFPCDEVCSMVRKTQPPTPNQDLLQSYTQLTWLTRESGHAPP